MSLYYLLGAMRQRDPKLKIATAGACPTDNLPPGAGSPGKAAISDPKRLVRSLDEQRAKGLLTTAG